MVEIPKGSIIFLDLDDTLYSEREYQASGFSEVIRYLGKPSLPSVGELVELSKAGIDVFAYLNLSELDKQKCLSLYRTHTPIIHMYADAHEFLIRAKDSGCRLALATDGRSVSQRNKLAALQVEDFFSWVFISEEMGATKRELTFYEQVLSVLDAEPTAFIGDNPEKDFVVPNSFQWTTIMLRARNANVHSQNLDNFSTEFLPQHVINNFGEIVFA